jgi:hypothetical protein
VTAAACEPDTTEFAWDQPTDEGLALVHSDLLTFDASDEQVSGGSTSRTSPDIEPFDLLDALGGNPDSWEDVLAASVVSANGIPEGFGDVELIRDTSVFEVESPVEGTYVRAVVASRLSVPFTLTCAGGAVASGTFTAVDPSNPSEVTIECADTTETDDPIVGTAREACDLAVQP